MNKPLFFYKMSNTLRQARILSSENDASVKQEQNTNIEIKVSPNKSIPPVAYPKIQPFDGRNAPPINQCAPNNVNFTMPPPTMPTQTMPAQTTQPQYASQYTPPINNITWDCGLADTPPISNFIDSNSVRGNELDTLEQKNRFLEMLVEMYADNPLRINSYVVCKSTLLMNMIKLLTGCDKVDFVLEDDEPGCCAVSVSKFIKIDKILITKDGKSEELKYAYNNVYTEFIKYGISLKLAV